MKVDPRVGVLLAAAGALWVGTQNAWWWVTWTDPFGGSDGGGGAGIGGMPATSGLVALLPATAIAAVLLTLTVATRGRRVVGVLVSLVGVACILLGLLPPEPGAELISSEVPWAGLGKDVTTEGTGAGVVYALLGALLLVSGLWLAWRPPSARRQVGQRAGASNVTDQRASWKAMDDGVDPTDEEEPA